MDFVCQYTNKQYFLFNFMRIYVFLKIIKNVVNFFALLFIYVLIPVFNSQVTLAIGGWNEGSTKYSSMSASKAK